MAQSSSSRSGSKADKPRVNSNPALDDAFAALTAYDLGSGRGGLKPIDEAVAAASDDQTARRALEVRLLAVLKSPAPPVAKEYVCRKLALVGSAEAVPALRELLADEFLSTGARLALENIPGDAPARALRDRLSRLSGAAQIGLINSLGARRDERSVSGLAKLLKSDDTEVVAAAIAALGNIGSPQAAKELKKFQPRAPGTLARPLADACLVCAGHLMSAQKRSDALALYTLLNGCRLPDYFKPAVARGLAVTRKG